MRDAAAEKGRALKPAPHEFVREQFEDAVQQEEASRIGMWTFLATEVLFFGALFTAYTEYRILHPAAWATGSAHLDFWLGTINTAVLLVSSLTMALSIHAVQHDRRGTAALLLFATVVLGIVFLGIKFTEYAHHFHDGLVPGKSFAYSATMGHDVQLFLAFYYAMTGLHAIHMTIGVVLVTILIFRIGRFSSAYHNPVVMTGLYWHFVDIVWIFLYPCFYLVGGK